VHISLVNIDAGKSIRVRSAVPGITWQTVTGRILTSSSVTDINTFETPGKVQPAVFNGAKKEGGELVVELPARSVVVLELK
jgi:alpha-N-arabinofuranosidase